MNNLIPWSYTRFKLYTSCPKSLFYFLDTYHPTNAGPRPVSISAIVGLAVHHAIAEHVERWRDGQTIDLQSTLDSSKGHIQHLWNNREKTIVELINNSIVERDLIHRLESATRKNLHTFFKAIWPQFKSHKYVSHETVSSFDFNSVRVWVKVDLCTRSNKDQLVVTDWKTGVTDPIDEDHLQLDAYALWAHEHFRVAFDRIIVQVANLRRGSLVKRTPTKTYLDEAKALIRQQVVAWSDLGSITSFVAQPDLEKCIRCQFLRKCPDGNDTLKTEAR